MTTLNEIKQVKAAVEAELLQRPGVTGVDIGYKYVGGQRTDDIAIRVLVEDKHDVAPEEQIPRAIDGITTDVIQRKIVLHPLKMRITDLETKADTTTYDPLKGGISIGPCRSINGFVYVGTLGAIVKDNATGNPMLLSNFHVMCVDNGWSMGDTMAQPSRVDGGSCPGGIVGSLQRASLGGQVDCAVSSHTARNYACEIVEIGEVTGTSTATLGMTIRKRGRTTGLTYGIVDSIDLTVSIDYEDGLGVVTLTNQIGIRVDTAKSTQFGNSGDSGSVVVNDNREVVGLYFAGTEDGTFGVANPIQAVLDALNVSICTAPVKSILKDWKDNKRESKEYKIEKREFKEWKREKLEFEKTRPEKSPKELVEGGKLTEIPNIPGIPTSGEQPAQMEAAANQPQTPAKLQDLKKREFKEIKEFKEKEKEIKEFKDKDKDFKEFKEIKEKDFKEFKEKDFKEFKEKDKDIFEGPKLTDIGTPTNPQIPIQPVLPGSGMSGSLEQRLTNLEATIAQLAHFISPELRPDLGTGALNREPDLTEAELANLSQELQKQASDAKQMKDNKDVEKPREGQI